MSKLIISLLFTLSFLVTAAPGMAESKKPPASKVASTVKQSKAARSAVLAKVNVNKADAAALAANLLGVGPTKAKAIVSYRSKHGPFKRAEDLLAVRGLGKSFLSKNKGRFSF